MSRQDPSQDCMRSQPIPSERQREKQEKKEDKQGCKYVIYRSSSAVIDAMQQGLIPIFFKGKKNNFQSDPLWQLKSKIIIKDTKELADIFKNKKYLKKKKKLNYLNFANDYYRPLNHKKLKKIF